jgi:hypothetical protein
VVESDNNACHSILLYKTQYLRGIFKFCLVFFNVISQLKFVIQFCIGHYQTFIFYCSPLRLSKFEVILCIHLLHILVLWRLLKLYSENSLPFLWNNTTITFVFLILSTLLRIGSCSHCHLPSLLWSDFKNLVINPWFLLLQFLLTLSPFGSNFYILCNICHGVILSPL